MKYMRVLTIGKTRNANQLGKGEEIKENPPVGVVGLGHILWPLICFSVCSTHIAGKYRLATTK